MGDAADDAFDAWCEAGCPSAFEQSDTRFTWKTKDGTILNMREMETSHIENAINKCIEYDNQEKLYELRQVLEERNLPDDGYTDYLKRIGQYQ